MDSKMFADVMFEDLKVYYPTDMDKAVRWYSFDRFELIVELSDGRKLLYDYVDKTTRWLGISKVDPEEDEERWKWEFSMRLCKRMQYQGMTQDELSKLTGLSPASISKYTNGIAVPSLFHITKIAKVLACPITYFLRFPK